MPRPNPRRELYAESHVARRIAHERETRSWSYEGLASRLGAIGCPIQASAIYKIEKGDPPRRITVNELVAFSMVFDLTVEEILVDPDARIPAELAQALERFQALRARIAEHERQKLELMADADAEVRRVVKLIEGEPGLQASLAKLGISDGVDGFLSAANDVITHVDALRGEQP